MPPSRVAVAMSGGVDSSVAAARLVDEGCQVFGVYLKLQPGPQSEEIAAVLGQTGSILGIRIYTLDLAAGFDRLVVDRFCADYARAVTPNPCVVCNREIKFGLLLERVRAMGADILATGHYARIAAGPSGCRLLRGADRRKDQSYFLYTLGQEQLSKVLFPVGGLTKEMVREMAVDLDLPAAEQRESQDICFIPGDYGKFLSSRISLRPGEIVSTSGRVLGKHRGLALYTVGQRRGLGIGAGEYYVLRLDAAANRLVVGEEAGLECRGLTASALSWVAGKPPRRREGITARVRYRSREVGVTFRVGGDKARVRFETPLSAVSPGQSIVFYRDDEVLGGGVIDAVM